MICPNINSKEYKRMATVLGGPVAHAAWANNNGQPIELNADGSQSENFIKLEKAYGTVEAIRLRAMMLSKEFQQQHGDGALSDDMTIGDVHVAPKVKKDAISNMVNTILTNNIAARNMDILVSNIERSLPGFRVIRENGSTITDNVLKNKAGWVDAKGLHLNMEYVTFQTPIHEITHILLPIIEKAHPELWKSIKSQFDAMILADKHWNTLKQRFPERDDHSLMMEYLSMIAGAVSERKVEQFLVDNNTAPTASEKQSFGMKVSRMVEKLWSAIKSALGIVLNTTSLADVRLEEMDLTGLFNIITNDVVNGRPIMRMTADERAAWTEYIDENGVETYEEFGDLDSGVTRVQSVKDLPNIIINNKDRHVMGSNADMWRKDPKSFAEMVYRRAYKSNNGDTINIEWMGKLFSYPGVMDAESIKSQIASTILEHHITTVESFPMRFEKTITIFSKGNILLEDAIEDGFRTEYGNAKISIPQVARLVELTGGHDRVKDILRLSELSTKYPEYAGVIDNSLIGYDPLIVIHDDKDVLDFSISDLAVGDLGYRDTINENNNRLLTHRFNTDFKTLLNKKDVTISWTNSKKDARAAALTLTLAGMNHLSNKAGKKIKVRRAGVYGIRGGGAGAVDGNIIVDFSNAFAQTRFLMGLTEMQALINNPLISAIVADDKAWDTKNMKITHEQELYSYYMTHRPGEQITEGLRTKLMGKNLSRDEHIRVLKSRMKFIASRISNPDENVEYQTLAKALMHFRKGWHLSNMNFNDIDSNEMRFLNVHNIGNSLVQYAGSEFEKAKSIVVNRAIAFNDQFTPLIEAVKKEKGIVGSSAEKIFDGMFPTVDVIADRDFEKTDDHKAVKAGQTIKVKLYNTIFSHSYAGKLPSTITESELKLGDFILKNVREIYIRDILNDLRTERYNATLEEATRIFEQKYTPGTIPVLPATMRQLFRQSKFKEGLKTFGNMLAHGDIQFADMGEDSYHHLENRFTEQKSQEAQLHSMGMSYVNDSYHTNNLDAIFMQSNNLEYAIKLFELQMEKKEVFNDIVLPISNELTAIANYVGKNIGYSMLNTRDFLTEYTKLIMYNQRKDYGEQGKMTKVMAPIARSAMQLFTSISIGARPVIWAKSLFFNEQAQWIGAIATNLSNIAIPEEYRSSMPGVKETMQAHYATIPEFKKMWALAKKMQLVNGTERDVMENLVNTVTDKTVLKQQLLHLGNWATDCYTRMVSMSAHMMKDGSWDAHTYDSKEGTISYDIKKDRRFYDDKGNKIDGWIQVADRIYEEQQMQGLLDENGNQTIGYEFGEINGRMKWYADKFLIGSMDPYQKVLLGNTWIGNAFGQFKTFSWDKIWNLAGGTFTGGIETEYGGSFKPIKGSDGEWITVREQQHMEGMLRSVVQCIRHGKDFLNKDAHYWQDMPPIRRRNVAEVGIRSAILLSLVAAVVIAAMGNDDDDEELRSKYATKAEYEKALKEKNKLNIFGIHISKRDAQKIQFMVSDLFAIDTFTGWYSNAIPMFNMLQDGWSILVGEQRVRHIVKYVGPVNDAIWLYELFGSNDQLWRTPQQTKGHIKNMLESGQDPSWTDEIGLKTPDENQE